jgi:hypothetical protein
MIREIIVEPTIEAINTALVDQHIEADQVLSIMLVESIDHDGYFRRPKYRVVYRDRIAHQSGS